MTDFHCYRHPHRRPSGFIGSLWVCYECAIKHLLRATR